MISDEELKGLYEAGFTTRMLADIYEVSHTTIATWLDRLGVERRGAASKRHQLVNDLTGIALGCIKIIKRDGIKYPVRWLTRCDCGNIRTYVLHELRVLKKCMCCGKEVR